MGIFHDKIIIFIDSIVYRILQMFTGSEQGIRLGVIANYFTSLSGNSVFEIIFGKGTGSASFFYDRKSYIFLEHNGR